MLGKPLSLERSLERSLSLGRLPSINRPPASRPLFSNHLRLINDTTASLATCIIICLLIFAMFRDHSNMNESASVLGKRSWKNMDMAANQRLESQLDQKAEELQRLRAQLTRIVASGRRAEINMASQELLITNLQQRQEAEKAGKQKALYALAERSRDLEECSRRQHLLDQELDLCQEGIGEAHSL